MSDVDMKIRMHAVMMLLLAAGLWGACADPAGQDDTRPDPTPSEPEQAVLPVLPRGIHALDTLVADAPTADLAPFFAATAEATVIGLGEAVHTSGGYYALKNRLIRALVEEQGVRVLVIETPRSYTGPLNTFVNTPGCLRRAAVNATSGSIFQVFVDENFIELLVGICQFNEVQPEGSRVRIFGTDAQQPDADTAAIQDFLRAYLPDHAEGLIAGLASCSMTISGFGTTPYRQADFTACTAGIDAIQGWVEAERAALQPLGVEFRLFELHLDSFRSWQEQVFYEMSGDYTRTNSARDLAMGQAYLVQQELFFPEERSVFWAHDYHLAAAHDQALLNFPPGAITAGTVLKRTLGDAYLPFAITSLETEVNWPGIQFNGYPSDGVEHELGELEADLLFVDDSADLMQREGASGLGSMALSLRDNFSGLFWLRSSLGMAAIYW